MKEVAILFKCKKGFGALHIESIEKDVAASNLELYENYDYEHLYYDDSDEVIVRLAADSVDEDGFNRLVDWICEYHEGNVVHKNF